jgi:hypothetical protein
MLQKSAAECTEVSSDSSENPAESAEVSSDSTEIFKLNRRISENFESESLLRIEQQSSTTELLYLARSIACS